MIFKGGQEVDRGASTELLDISIKLGQRMKKVAIVESGKTIDSALLDTLSKVGGLFTSLFGIFSIIEHRLTRAKTIGIMT